MLRCGNCSMGLVSKEVYTCKGCEGKFSYCRRDVCNFKNSYCFSCKRKFIEKQQRMLYEGQGS